MRVGLFSDCYVPDINGVVSSIVTLKSELEKLGHEVYVVATMPNKPVEEDSTHIMRLSGVELKNFYGYVITQPIHLIALNQIKEWNLDVIHVQTEFGVGMFARIVAKTLGIPLVSTYHTQYEDYTHYINFLDLKAIDTVSKKAIAQFSKLLADTSVEVIAPSSKTKELLLKYGSKGRIHVIPTGLDLDRFDKSHSSKEDILKCREECHVKEDEAMIVFVGRIAKEKSIDLVIDGFNVLKKRNANAKFVIVGDGPGIHELKKQVQDLDLNDWVYFMGKKPASEVPLYYHAADGFVSASLSETQGMTFVEALASSTPVFARPDDVLDDLVYEGKTGFYFNDAEEFAQKVESFLSLNQDQKEEIAQCARVTAMKYDSAAFGKSVEQVYESAIHHFAKLFSIEKIKTKEDCVELTVESKIETIKVLVDLDTYVEYGLRKGSKITQECLDELLQKQKVMLAYLGCIKKLVTKDRTKKEMYDWLTMKTDCSIGEINDLILKLEKRGLLDDERYAYSYLDSVKGLLMGRNKIIYNLRKKGVPYEIIEHLFDTMDSDDEVSNALKWALKIQPTIKDKSVKMKKYAMRNKLSAQGYNYDIINQVMEQLSFSAEESAELDNLRKVANKAKKRYMNRYSGTKLRNTVYRYCASQGFKQEDIYFVLSEMEWEDE